MFLLTREVRLNVTPAPMADGPPSANGHAGVPAVDCPFQFVLVRVTLRGAPAVASGYVRNIKEIDERVRVVLPLLREKLLCSSGSGYLEVAAQMFRQVNDAWPGCQLSQISILPSPATQFTVLAEEPDMIRLSQRFEFSAAHRLHNPAVDADENRRLFGKCNNPLGHGHNYEVQVTLSAAAGAFPPIATIEKIVDTHAIDRLDHKNLNEEVDAFAVVNPSVEQIAKVIYDWLKPPLTIGGARLASVTVWETPRTWCEYSE